MSSKCLRVILVLQDPTALNDRIEVIFSLNEVQTRSKNGETRLSPENTFFFFFSHLFHEKHDKARSACFSGNLLLVATEQLQAGTAYCRPVRSDSAEVASRELQLNYQRLSPNHTKPDNLMFWSRNLENLDVPRFFYLSDAHEHASCAETKYQVPQVFPVSLLGSEWHEYQPHPSCWLVGCAQPTANCQQQHCHDQHVPFITEGQDLTIQDVLVFDGTSVKVSKWCKFKYLAASFLCCANDRSLHLLVQYSLLQWYGMLSGGAGWGKAIWCILLGSGLHRKQKNNVATQPTDLGAL